MVRIGVNFWWLTDHAETGARKDGTCLVGFSEETCHGVFANVAGTAEDGDAEDPVAGLRQAVGTSPADGPQVVPVLALVFPHWIVHR